MRTKARQPERVRRDEEQRGGNELESTPIPCPDRSGYPPYPCSLQDAPVRSLRWRLRGGQPKTRRPCSGG